MVTQIHFMVFINSQCFLHDKQLSDGFMKRQISGLPEKVVQRVKKKNAYLHEFYTSLVCLIPPFTYTFFVFLS